MPLVPPRRWSLRARLLAVLMTLLVTVCLVVGAVTVLALRGQLVARLDAQLDAAGGRSASAGGPTPPSSGNASGNGNGTGAGAAGTGAAGGQQGGAQFLLAPGQAAGTLGARITDDGIVAAGVLGQDGSLTPLSAAQVAALVQLPVDGRPHTLSVGQIGEFRLLARRTSGGDVLVTGLPMRDVDRTVYRVIAIEAGVALLALVLATGAGALVLRRTLRPLQRVAATATRVSALPLARGEVALGERLDAGDVDDRTEVGQVAGAVNRLLDHVSSALTARQASETRVRHFVADASHELRTPLAAIRGYAELTRRSRDIAPPDIAHALARVESEAARMTTMVDDLLLLARLDADPTVARTPVDLTHLLLDAVSDASAAARDHQWRMDLPDFTLSVPGDEGRLHQVLANLLANARTHTPPGTTVTAGWACQVDDSVVISVVDDGPGIATDVQPTIFERFTRGPESRSVSSGVGSSGLGLAIVSAIVTAHDGSVDVVSRPGHTKFSVRLPLT